MGALLRETELFPTDYVESFVTPITLNSLLEERRYFEPLDVFPRQRLRGGFRTTDPIFEKPVHIQKTRREVLIDNLGQRDKRSTLAHLADQFPAEHSCAEEVLFPPSRTTPTPSPHHPFSLPLLCLSHKQLNQHRHTSKRSRGFPRTCSAKCRYPQQNAHHSCFSISHGSPS